MEKYTVSFGDEESLLMGSLNLVRSQFFRKTNMSYYLIHARTCAFQWVRKVSFGKFDEHTK